MATLLHLGLFHLGGQFATATRVVTWAWIAIYIVVPLLMVIILAVQLRTPGGDPPRSVPLPGWVCGLLAVQAVVLLGLGVALFAAPGQAAWWPWTLTPLLAQATGAWLIGFGVAAAHQLAERDARRLLPASFSCVLLAVLQFIALARYPGRFEWSSAAGVIYLAFLVMMLVTGGAVLAQGQVTPGRAAALGLRRSPNALLPSSAGASRQYRGASGHGVIRRWRAWHRGLGCPGRPGGRGRPGRLLRWRAGPEGDHAAVPP